MYSTGYSMFDELFRTHEKCYLFGSLIIETNIPKQKLWVGRLRGNIYRGFYTVAQTYEVYLPARGKNIQQMSAPNDWFIFSTTRWIP